MILSFFRINLQDMMCQKVGLASFLLKLRLSNYNVTPFILFFVNEVFSAGSMSTRVSSYSFRVSGNASRVLVSSTRVEL